MSDQEWIIQVPTPNWVTKMNNQLTSIAETRSTESKRWQMQSIYRIPQCVKELRSTTASSIGPYDPQMVSIGPYHHGKQQLQSIEEHKQRALLTFLERSKKPLHSYVDALMPVVEDLKEAYHDLDPQWKQDTEAFLQLMIVDGCFILEIMRATSAKTTMGYADEDPIFSNHGRLYFVPYLRRDMLMLENQLPLRLLFELLLVEDGGIIMSNGYSKQDHLSVLILEFFSLPHDLENIQEFKNCLHILDMYRRSMLMHLSCGRTAKPKKSCSDCLPRGGRLKNADAYIRSATELKEAGIRFERSKTCNLNDISFKGGVLTLPLILVDDALESQYLNMMALERFHVGLGNHVTSFVFFMDSIIDSARDVALLHSYGIIQNALGSDKAVANLFNSLSTDATLDDNDKLGIVQKQVAEYCEMLFPRWIAYAKHNYFTNPWVGLSIVAAIFLFALTGIQTAYTVLGYYHSK